MHFICLLRMPVHLLKPFSCPSGGISLCPLLPNSTHCIDTAPAYLNSLWSRTVFKASCSVTDLCLHRHDCFDAGRLGHMCQGKTWQKLSPVPVSRVHSAAAWRPIKNSSCALASTTSASIKVHCCTRKFCRQNLSPDACCEGIRCSTHASTCAQS
jgi:hypothetical protein